MTYNAAIPQPTDLISNSQAQILANFSQLNAQFGIDHVAFNTGSGNGDGHHKQVTLDASTTQTPTGTQSVFFSTNGVNLFSGVPIAYFANSSGSYPILPDPILSATNNGFTLGTIKINFGTVTIVSSSSATVTFSVPFTTSASYALTVTPLTGSSLTEGQWSYSHGASGSSCTVRRGGSASGTISFTYIAIGT